MADITVPVPDERTAEFYQFFGLWLAGSLSLNQASSEAAEGSVALPETSEPVKLTPWGDDDSDFADAVALWHKYSPRARAMFSLLIDNPGKEYTGADIAEACNIPNGAHGVAGVLAWPGRHGAKLKRGLPSAWREDPETLESYYWMSEKRAAFFKSVRESAEAASDD